ncbi:MAG: uracil-DNA glycosylase family protein [Anaerococcus sp.]|nr:uracil-DNA glycosylase family protein [Anaerococcus sp.]
MDKDKLIEELMADSRNKTYSKKGLGPIFQLNKECKILIIGQAPGKKVEETGILFNDKSGDRLCEWMGISKKTLYSKDISIMPMDFYYPGKAKSGDKPPRKFIARDYHPLFLENLTKVKLKVLLGLHANKYYLKDGFKKNLTQTIKDYESYLPEIFPLIHPSGLNNRWISKNPFFESKILPALKRVVDDTLKS